MEFYLYIPELMPVTIMIQFLNQLNEQVSLWHELIWRTGEQFNNNLSKSLNIKLINKPQNK